MNKINLQEFKEIIITEDIKYLRFIDQNSNKMYLVEDYNDKLLEEKVEDLLKLESIDDVKDYFIKNDPNTNIFEFISSKDLKNFKEEIKNMNDKDKEKLTMIVKSVKTLNIKYINFSYFFFEDENEGLHYINETKSGNISIKNLKIEKVIIPTDINVVLRDIKAYGAFKFRNKTYKYEDIKKYIDNPLLSIDNDIKWIIDKIREHENKDKINHTIKKDLEIKDIKREVKEKEEIKDEKTKNNNKKRKKEKGNIWIYCLTGFTIGVVLAAITIIIGSYL